MTISFVALFFTFLAFGVLEKITPLLRRPPDRDERWPSNWALMGVDLALNALNPLSAIWVAEQAQNSSFGLLNLFRMPEWATVVITLGVVSLVEYAQHVASHKLPLLWRIHRLHHLDTHFDISTANRHHPFEITLGLIFIIPPVCLIGLSPTALSIYFVAWALFNVASHADIRLPQEADRLLRLFIVTPSMHCIHHSARQRETDSNYGAVFSFWDRLFGTYHQVALDRYEVMTIGLSEVQDPRASDFIWQLKSPFLRTLNRDLADQRCADDASVPASVQRFL